jgi:hypothetical protein
MGSQGALRSYHSLTLPQACQLQRDLTRAIREYIKEANELEDVER